MTLNSLLGQFRLCPLIASVQSTEGSPSDNPETLRQMALASIQEGVTTLRMQGIDNIRAVRASSNVPIIGLIKRNYPDSEVYITPTVREVDDLLSLGVEVIALDATQRARPCSVDLGDLIKRVHSANKLVLADIDTLESAIAAEALGADLISTTLAGYTATSPNQKGPDLELLRKVINSVSIPVLAEGRYAQKWQIEAALRMGASGVVVGGALNDPIKTTQALKPARTNYGKVGAVDIGGTWMRFAVFSNQWELESIERMPVFESREDRIDWIRNQIKRTGVDAVGVSTGGTVDPKTGELWEAKALIPDHVGSIFSEQVLGVPTLALNDGLASAWGHACLPQFAGKRVATLALGTGVGCGFVAEGSILMGPRGEYPRINDLPGPGGQTYEQMLGGAALSPDPTPSQMATALQAFLQAGILLQEMYFPDQIVVCGAVGLSEWLSPYLRSSGLSASPFGLDAGIFGAAALVLFPSH